MGQRGYRLETDRARLTDLQAFGERVGGVRLLHRIPLGAGLLYLSLRILQFPGERALCIPPGGQLLFLSL